VTARIRRHVVVHGQVQGVYFRDSVRRLARELGVSGWIRNRPDGAVEAALEGAPDAVERIIEWSHQGPLGARVDQVEVYEEQPSGETGFRVL
jgi:acylphosphatase